MMKTKFPATVMVFGVISREGHIMPPHIVEVGLKSQHQSVAGYAEECGDLLMQSGGQWQTLGVACRTRRRPTSPKRPRLGFRRSAATFYPFLTVPLLPLPEPAALLRLVIGREHHQHDLPQHQSQPDRRHPPSIR